MNAWLGPGLGRHSDFEIITKNNEQTKNRKKETRTNFKCCRGSNPVLKPNPSITTIGQWHASNDGYIHVMYHEHSRICACCSLLRSGKLRSWRPNIVHFARSWRSAPRRQGDERLRKSYLAWEGNLLWYRGRAPEGGAPHVVRSQHFRLTG